MGQTTVTTHKWAAYRRAWDRLISLEDLFGTEACKDLLITRYELRIILAQGNLLKSGHCSQILGEEHGTAEVKEESQRGVSRL